VLNVISLYTYSLQDQILPYIEVTVKVEEHTPTIYLSKVYCIHCVLCRLWEIL